MHVWLLQIRKNGREWRYSSNSEDGTHKAIVNIQTALLEAVRFRNENMKQVETRSLRTESSENLRANADSINTIVSLTTLPRIIYWQTTY